MLTNFFQKSNPVNLLVIFLLALLVYFFSITAVYGWGANDLLGLQETVSLIGFCGTALLLNYLFRIEVHESTTYAALIFVLLFLALPTSPLDYPVIISGIFVILGLRRAYTVENQKQITRKIFDSYFFLTLATLFFPPAILFMALPFLYLFYFVPYNYRHWLTPILPMSSIGILLFVYSLFFDYSFFNFKALFHFEIPQNGLEELINLSLPLLFLLLLFIWSLSGVYLDKSYLPKTQKRNRVLLISFLLTCLAVILISSSYTSAIYSSFYYAFIPLSFLSSIYLQSKTRFIFKEIFLYLTILGSIFISLNYFLSFIQL